MKLLSVSLLVLLSLASCMSNSHTSSTPNAIGGQRDKHDCLVGAGQTWSTLRHTCIQVFNEGIRLNPVGQKEHTAVFSAFIIYNQDQSKAELFLPNESSSNVLTTNDKITYHLGSYSYDSKTGILSIGGTQKYRRYK